MDSRHSARKPLKPQSAMRPTREQLLAAYGKTIRDVIAAELWVLFVGINPSLYSAAVGHHFARPGNRFWPTLYGAGFTDRLLAPAEERQLLERGYGITNMVNGATAQAAELTQKDLANGIRQLEKKVARFRPRSVAFLGISAYQLAWDPRANSVGPQKTSFGGARVWVLPNPSGLNAHYQLPELVRLFRDLRLQANRAARRPEPSNAKRRFA
jgi:TDG/mug DNA glycosylase family protein